jgi:myxalamid-type nonribosomal peptide synthetase MxaA
LRRIEASMRFFKCWSNDLRERIRPIPGDLSEANLGISAETHQVLCSSIDSIYHCGALVNFVYPYSVLRAPNVEGTANVLRLACTARAKAVHYISSIDTLLATRAQRPFLEDFQVSRNPARVPDGYPRSKWVGEALVKAAGDRGLPVTVFRPGLIMGHSATGATPTSNYLAVGLKGYIELGILPDTEDLFDIIPVDYAADAIVKLSLKQDSRGKAFHLWNHQPLATTQVYDWVRSYGYAVETVSAEFARQRVITVDSSNPLYPFVPHFRQEDPATVEMTMFHPQIMKNVSAEDECRNTILGLAGTGLSCPAIGQSSVYACLNFLVDVGFLPKPASRLPRATH